MKDSLSGMEIPRYQGQSPSRKQERGGKDRKSRVAGYERFLHKLVWKSRDTRVGVLHRSKREEAKIGKVEWQDMKDSLSSLS